MGGAGTHFSTWWRTLLHPATAGDVVLEPHRYPGLNRFMLGMIIGTYGVYGVSMGLFGGSYPALVSGMKLSLLYFLTILICLFPFYVANCLLGPRMGFAACYRLLLFLVSANAVAVVSYAPVSYFFVLTSSKNAYAFLVLMHVAVLGLAGAASVVENIVILRATAERLGRRVRPTLFAAWGILYALVGTHAAWTLRPWISSPDIPYQPLRPISGSFIEAVIHLFGKL